MDEVDPENSFDADHDFEEGVGDDQKTSWLLPGRLIAGLVALILIFIVVSQLMRKPETNERPTQASSQPAPVTTAPEMPTGAHAAEIFQSLSGVNVRTDNVRRQLDRLRESVERTVQSSGTDGYVQRLLSPNFQAIAIDRDRFASRLEDSLVKVSRWSYDKSAPVFSDSTDAVKNFCKSAYEPWVGQKPFRLDLNIYTIDEQETSIRTTIVANAFGKTADSSSRQATSLWETVWSRPKSPKEMPLLQSIKVVAQEELATAFKTDQLLADCTVSVLRRCKCLPEQLDYGIDQWRGESQA